MHNTYQTNDLFQKMFIKYKCYYLMRKLIFLLI